MWPLVREFHVPVTLFIYASAISNRAYNIAVAREAAEAGFDEIQFDYARLPDAVGLVYHEPDTLENRVAAIGYLLREARGGARPVQRVSRGRYLRIRLLEGVHRR
jgi:hypothetical protein